MKEYHKQVKELKISLKPSHQAQRIINPKLKVKLQTK